jgi:hypothetical protein
VLYPLGLGSRSARLEAVLKKTLEHGAEPYALVERTLANLRAVRVLQISESLSAAHPCFRGAPNLIVEVISEDASQSSGYANSDPLTLIRVTIAPAAKAASSLESMDVVIGNSQILMSGLIDAKQSQERKAKQLSITFPANGMTFGDLRNGVVRVCTSSSAAQGISADAITVEISKGGGVYSPFKTWKNVSFPAEKNSSVTFRDASLPSLR